MLKKLVAMRVTQARLSAWINIFSVLTWVKKFIRLSQVFLVMTKIMGAAQSA